VCDRLRRDERIGSQKRKSIIAGQKEGGHVEWREEEGMVREEVGIIFELVILGTQGSLYTCALRLALLSHQGCTASGISAQRSKGPMVTDSTLLL
jgi:hypothetical protein